MQKSVIVLATAIVIGFIADLLLKSTFMTGVPMGIGMPLLIDILAFATICLAFKSDKPLVRKGLYFLVPAAIFSTGFACTDSPTLLAIDLGVVFLSLTFSAIALTGGAVTTGGIVNYLAHIANGLLIPLISAADLLSFSIKWDQILPQEWGKHAASVTRGLVIGVPITAVFFALFVSADAAFAAIAGKAVHVDVFDMAANFGLTAVATWLSAGYLHSFTTSKPPALALDDSMGPRPAQTATAEIVCPPPSTSIQLNITEVTVALSLVNALFFSFVLVQLKFLFGGASLVNLTPGLSFAEYARKGFFDLNIAAALVLPMLLVVDHWLKKTTLASTVVFRTLAGTLIGLLSVVMASAFMRMHLYQTEYGQSELRLYTMVFMGWLATVCIVFAGTVMTGRRQYFAFGSFLTGLATIGGLHALNPDNLIAVANIGHAKCGKPFDAPYLMTLSADAIPGIVKNIDGLSKADQQTIAQSLTNQHSGAWHADWRSFNFSRAGAFNAVHDNLPKLEKMARGDKSNAK
jgi:hypothetical protein